MRLSEEIKSTFKDAAKKLTGSKKRDFTAKVTQDYLGGSARRAESVFGWKRQSVGLGLQERRTGIICVENYAELAGTSPKKTQKTKPLKKIAETDAIFEHVWTVNQAADENIQSLRLSIDSKAKVKIGNLSRDGKARTIEPTTALDHDTQWDSILVPFGILTTQNDQ